MSPDRPNYQKQVYPNGESGSTIANNQPDIPQVTSRPIKDLSIQTSARIHHPHGFVIQETSLAIKKDGENAPARRSVRITRLTPVTKDPLTKARIVEVGGRSRSIGGGTSKEALRKAKKKAK